MKLEEIGDDISKIVIFHILCLMNGKSTEEILKIEKETMGSDLIDIMLSQPVPFIGMDDQADHEYVWTIYGRFLKSELPNLRG